MLNLKKGLKLKELGLHLILNDIFLFKDILKKLNENNALLPVALFRNYIDDKIFFKGRCKINYKTYIRLYTKSFIPEKFSIYYKAYIFNDALLKEFK